MRNNKATNENLKTQVPNGPFHYTPVLNIIRSDTSNVGQKCIRDCVKLGTEVIVSAALVTPLVIGQWRGTWMLLEYYGIPWWMCFLTGSILHFIFALLKDILQDYFSNKKQECLLILLLVSRVYTWVFGVACATHWRGGWMMLEEYLRLEIGPAIAVTLLSLAVLSFMNTLRNITIFPLSISVDGLEPRFAFPTMFRTSVSRETPLYVLDCLFSVFIVGTLVVFVWRGAWTILDIYLYPQQAECSAWTSMVLGYIIVLLAFSLQSTLKSLCGRLVGFWRFCVVDVYLFFSFCGTINVWRGVWLLLNAYFLPDNHEASYWITHVGCLVLLVLINCSNSILVRGVYIDAEEEGGNCVVFPCYYLRLLFQKKRKAKLQRMQIQQLHQQQTVLFVAAGKRKNENENKEMSGFATPDIPQTNNTANNHAKIPLAAIPLQTLQDVP